MFTAACSMFLCLAHFLHFCHSSVLFLSPCLASSSSVDICILRRHRGPHDKLPLGVRARKSRIGLLLWAQRGSPGANRCNWRWATEVVAALFPISRRRAGSVVGCPTTTTGLSLAAWSRVLVVSNISRISSLGVWASGTTVTNLLTKRMVRTHCVKGFGPELTKRCR